MKGTHVWMRIPAQPQTQLPMAIRTPGCEGNSVSTTRGTQWMVPSCVPGLSCQQWQCELVSHGVWFIWCKLPGYIGHIFVAETCLFCSHFLCSFLSGCTLCTCAVSNPQPDTCFMLFDNCLYLRNSTDEKTPGSLWKFQKRKTEIHQKVANTSSVCWDIVWECHHLPSWRPVMELCWKTMFSSMMGWRQEQTAPYLDALNQVVRQKRRLTVKFDVGVNFPDTENARLKTTSVQAPFAPCHTRSLSTSHRNKNTKSKSSLWETTCIFQTNKTLFLSQDAARDERCYHCEAILDPFEKMNGL